MLLQNIIKKIAVTTLSMGFLLGVSNAAELKLANFMSPSHPYEKTVFQALADEVSKQSGGALTVRVYSGGELGGGPVEQYNRALDGIADIVFALPGYTAQVFKRTLLSELPGVLTEETATQKIWDNIDFIKADFNRVKLLSIWSNSKTVIYTRDIAIRSIDDIKGLKIRVSSRNAGLLIQSWGATPVSMPVSELYNSMQSGVIDGAFIDSTATLAFKLGEVANYITTGMDTSIYPFALYMNKDSYGSLSTELQKILDSVGKDISFTANKVQISVANNGIKMFKEKEGHELIELTDEQAVPFNKASKNMLKAVLKAADDDGLSASKYIAALQE